MEFIPLFIPMLILMIYLILGNDKKPPQVSGLHFVIQFNHIKICVIMADMKNTQFLEGNLVVKDIKGDDTTVQSGSVEVSSSNEEVFTAEKDEEDETKIKVIGHRAGAGILKIKADADLGEGVRHIETEVAINVLPSEATGFSVNFGEPQDQ